MNLSFYDDPEFAKRYAEGAVQFVPGYRVMQRVAAQLIRERMGDAGNVLVIGAGGGLELEEFASRGPAWRFVGVEPAMPLLRAALIAISAVYLVRGLAFVPFASLVPDRSWDFWLWSSAICTVFGVVHAVGLWQSWGRLSAARP